MDRQMLDDAREITPQTPYQLDHVVELLKAGLSKKDILEGQIVSPLDKLFVLNAFAELAKNAS